MINLIHAEIYKFKKSLALKVCLLVSIISAVSLTLISHNIATGKLGYDVVGSASGLSEVVIVSLLGCLLASILVCSDFETKTIHDIVASDKGRSMVVISKVIVYVGLMILVSLPYMLSGIIGFATKEEFAKPFVSSLALRLLYEGTEHSVSVAVIVKMIIISLVTILIFAARLSICVLLAFKIRKPIAITAIGFIFSAVIDLLLSLFDGIPVLGDLINMLPFNIGFLCLTLNSDVSDILKATASSLVFMLLITGVTYASFRKAEIK